MRQYEVMCIIRPDLEEEQTAELVEKINRIVTDGGGEVTELDAWGVKRLAYEIKDYTEGYYVVMKCRAEHAVVSELDRIFRITDGILRHIIIREDQ